MSDFDFFEDTYGIEAAQQTQNILIDTQERIGMVLDLLPMGLFIHQPMGILFANQAACSIFGQTSDAMVGQHILDFVSEKNRPLIQHLMDDAFDKNDPAIIDELDIIQPNGNHKVFKIIASSLPWEGTPVIQILAHDISEAKFNERELIRLSETDPLTGAYNRRKFITLSQTTLQQAKQQVAPLCLITLDIDHFKKVNDSKGHEAGDVALKSVVETIHICLKRHNQNLDPEDHAVLARMGGEEFAVLIPKSSPEESKRLANLIKVAIEDTPIETFLDSFHITTSIGLTTLINEDKTIDHLLRRADKALYLAKSNGRNRVEVALSDDDEQDVTHHIARSEARND